MILTPCAVHKTQWRERGGLRGTPNIHHNTKGFVHYFVIARGGC